VGVDVEAVHPERGDEDVTGRVDDEGLARVLARGEVPEVLPGGHRLLDVLAPVDDPGGAPVLRDDVLVVRVERQAAEPRIDVLQGRQTALVAVSGGTAPRAG